MSERNRPQSQAEPGSSPTNWTSLQAYLLAAFCLLLGVALGYLFHGSASPAAQAATVPAVSQPDTSAPTQQNAQAEAALAQAVAPFEDAVKKNPNDYDALVQLEICISTRGNFERDSKLRAGTGNSSREPGCPH